MNQEVENSEKQFARMVGSIIAAHRKAKGLTQAQLAEYMDVEKETISRMETGVISPTLARLAQIAKFLDCDVSDLLKNSSPELSDYASSLARRMENLTDSQRAILTQFLGRVATGLEKLKPKDRKVVELFLKDIM
ncbi:helix-turn-helix domain-containing protein [Undibacterium sp. Ji50W]|uniref:helix-turn-helix domain-containing protein n=1 Tax=Undibacterium sp. Ji50W TaxID=3413041 RepID=UPI003BF15D24